MTYITLCIRVIVVISGQGVGWRYLPSQGSRFKSRRKGPLEVKLLPLDLDTVIQVAVFAPL